MTRRTPEEVVEQVLREQSFNGWASAEEIAIACIKADREQREAEPVRSQGLCDTTMTERFSSTCVCDTYPGNLGPCLTWEEGGSGRCAYCEHGKQCHEELLRRLPQREAEVPDAEVEAALREWRDHEFDDVRDLPRMRLALEAARKVRP